MPTKKVIKLGVQHSSGLIELFNKIDGDITARNFHPHPFTELHALDIAKATSSDLYLGLLIQEELIGYGMLRGWDAGYEIPTLGIYVMPEYRGHGYSSYFMNEMHLYAKNKGAAQVMLRVYPDNLAALNLYKRLGYTFNEMEHGQIIGRLNLSLVI